MAPTNISLPSMMAPNSQDHKTQIFFAHSANGQGDWHPLAEHLASVSRIAKEFLKGWKGEEEAGLAGILHDLGKYGDRFQARLHGKDQGLDHWSQGASLALRHRAVAAALAIEGHHIGLQRGSKDSLKRLLPDNLPAAVLSGLALSEPNVERLQSLAAKDGLNFTTPARFMINSWAQAVAAMLDVRLLFSCLVDADFLDTEAHFEGDAQGKRPRPEGPKLDASAALAKLDTYMANLRNATSAQEAVRQVRETLWSAVIRSGHEEPGTFTLTAPTGSGKTLAMLKFALEHAAKHGLKRIVLAVPFLTVIEQTARIYRTVFKAFPDNFVLEH